MPVSHTTVTLQDESGNTLLTSVTSYDTEKELKQVLEMGMEEGLKQTLDNLERFLTK